MTDQSSKILFVAMDAGDKDLIREWALDGSLPAFRSLFERAAWVETRNPIGFYVGAVWPSFATGVSPARHGRYCYRQLQPGSYKLQPFFPEHLKVEPFWNHLSRAGKRVAVIDVPKVPKPRDINGLELTDWMTHDPDKQGFHSWPEELKEEVTRTYGPGDSHSCNADRKSPEDFFALRDRLRGRIATKAALNRDFYRREDWDLFLTVFAESHCIGHQGWHLRDPKHPRHDPEVSRACGDLIKDIYQSIDAKIGELMREAGPETTLFVLTSHGMGPHYDASFLLDEILRSLEDADSGRRYQSSLRRFFKRAENRMADAKFAPGREFFKRLYRRLTKGLDQRFCFKVPNNDAYGAIRVNVAGREPHGKVRPGREYEAFCENLIRDLKSFLNVDTKERLVQNVYYTRDLYPPSDQDHLPDLLVEWNRSAPITRVFSPKTGLIEGAFRGCRTGDHKLEGLFFAQGPGIRPGQIIEGASVMDLAPTVCDYLGVPLPDVEGKSLRPLWSERIHVQNASS